MRFHLISLTVLVGMAVAPVPAGGDNYGIPVRITVDDAVDRALDHDPQLQATRKEHQFNLRRIGLSRRDLFPSISFSYSGMDSVRYHGADSYSRRLSAGLEQLLFSGGRRRSTRKLQPVLLELSALAVEESALQVRLMVIGTFVRTLAVEETVKLLVRLLESTKAQRDITSEEYRLGIITEFQLITVELALRGVEIDLIHAENSLRRQQLQLSRAIGLPSEPGVQLLGTINPEYRGTLEPDDVDLFLARARQDNPQLNRARIDVTMAHHDLQNARREWIPDVRIRAEAHAAGQGFPLTEPGFTLSATISFAPALMPGETTLTAGRQTADERSRGISATARPGDNLGALMARQVADFAYERAGRQLDNLGLSTGHRIEDLIDEIQLIRSRLLLLESRLEMENRAAAVDLLRLDLGQITRGQLVEADITRSKTGIEINQLVVNLVASEIALLHELGDDQTTFEQLIHCERIQ